MMNLEWIKNAFQNTHVDVKLEGWAATTSIAAICASYVGVTAIKARSERTMKERKSDLDRFIYPPAS